VSDPTGEKAETLEILRVSQDMINTSTFEFGGGSLSKQLDPGNRLQILIERSVIHDTEVTEEVAVATEERDSEIAFGVELDESRVVRKGLTNVTRLVNHVPLHNLLARPIGDVSIEVVSRSIGVEGKRANQIVRSRYALGDEDVLDAQTFGQPSHQRLKEVLAHSPRRHFGQLEEDPAGAVAIGRGAPQLLYPGAKHFELMSIVRSLNHVPRRILTIR